MKPTDRVQNPVFLLLYRRPEDTRKVWDRIREAQPRQLFLVADGPHKGRPEERAACEEVRRMVREVDWDCEVHRNFAPTNMGIRDRFVSGLDWAFERVDRLIILEDDTVPLLSFFRFCDELLDRFEKDSRVMAVCATNLEGEGRRDGADYYFTRLPQFWGWATWKRAWSLYERPKYLSPLLAEGFQVAPFFRERRNQRFWKWIMRKVDARKLDSIMYRWNLSCILNDGLMAVSRVSLVRNIGFGFDSTHTSNREDWRGKLPVEEMTFPLKHPEVISPDLAAETFARKHNFYVPSLKTRVVFKVKRTFSNR